MRRLLVAFVLLTAVVEPASAGVIYDIQTGAYEPGVVPDVTGAVVTAIYGYPESPQFFCTELPAGPNRAIFVMFSINSPDHAVVSPGDVITIQSPTYAEYDDGLPDAYTRLELHNVWQISITGTTDVPVFDVDLAALAGDYRPIESCLFHAVDGFQADTTADPDLYGVWDAHHVGTGETWRFVDIQHTYIPVSEGDCYQGFVGILREPELQRFFVLGLLGIEIIDCSLPVQAMSFGSVKSLYK